MNLAMGVPQDLDLVVIEPRVGAHQTIVEVPSIDLLGQRYRVHHARMEFGPRGIPHRTRSEVLHLGGDSLDVSVGEREVSIGPLPPTGGDRHGRGAGSHADRGRDSIFER